MAGNNLKTPLGWSLNRFASDKFGDLAHLLGQALPCSVTQVVSSEIVTVKFELDAAPFTLPNVTIAVATAQYVRLPLQVGDAGVAIPANVYIGGVTGLGGGTADLTQVGNLTPLIFVPVGNTKWSAVDNNALTLYGPNGVVIEDQAKHCVITVGTSGITIIVPSGDNVAITGDLHVSGKIIGGFGGSDQVELDTHVHSDGGGTGPSGPPVPGT